MTDPQRQLELLRLRAQARARARQRQAQQRTQQPQPPQRGQSRDLQTEFTQTLASINRGIPFAQDVQNVIRGGVSMAQGGTFQEGVEQQRQENRELQSDFRTRRPYAAAFAEGTGNAVPVIATMGTAAPATVSTQTASRGLPLFTQQTVRGGATGATWGGVYGAGTGDAPNLDNWEDRLDRANEGAALGGAFGAATPAAVNAVRPVIEPAWRAAMRTGGALRRTAEQIPTPAPNSVGMSGGNLQARPPGSGALRPPPPAAPPREEIPEAGINMIDRMRVRERMSVDDLDQAFSEARARPQGQTVVDMFGDTGTRTLRPMVQGPGETSRRAQEVARELGEEAPDILMNSLRRGLSVRETPAQAMTRLEADYNRMSAELYNPIWERPLSRQAAFRLQDGAADLLNAPIVRRAIARADELFDNDLALGLVQGRADDHVGRWFHYVKMGMDDLIRTGRRDGSIEGNLYRQANEARAQLLRVMDDNIEGYQGARSQWAGAAAAEDALEEGVRFLTMLPDEVEARRADMTPFELDHARIGLASEIRRLTVGDANRNVNVASVLGNRDRQRVIAAMFDTPEQGAEFLGLVSGNGSRGAPGLYRLMENRQQWRGGSSTYANAMHGADEATQAGVEVAARVGSGDLGGAARRGVDWARNQVTLGMVERANNRRGEVALRRIDSEEARAFTDEIIRILRQREASRIAAPDAAVAATSPVVGSQQGRD